MKWSLLNAVSIALAAQLCAECNRHRCVVAAAPDLEAMIHSAGKQHQLALTDSAGASVVTITRLVTVSPQYPTAAVPQISKDGKGAATSGDSDGAERRSPTAEVHRRKWSSLILTPMRLVKALALASFSYAAYPVWTIACWVVRVLIFRPAVFIYLLCLERPLQALVSVFFWILPTLVFTIVATLLGTLIGGASGWISAVATNMLNAPAKDSRPFADTIPHVQRPSLAVDRESHVRSTFKQAKRAPRPEQLKSGTPKSNGRTFSKQVPEIKDTVPKLKMWTRRKSAESKASSSTTAPSMLVPAPQHQPKGTVVVR
ncbi:hypothetical protein GQ54DRAFT_40784 [Martensiomyces pterosporus]|nr:hypothetical protein GQ54DRAFT_40784 [Martensiomyces pterosporus]